MNTKELEFAVFCIENAADELGLTGAEIYSLLTKKAVFWMTTLFPLTIRSIHREKNTL